MKKRLLPFLLALCMVLTLLPGGAPTSKAYDPEYVKVGTMADLKEKLEASGDLNITVTDEIVHTVQIGYYEGFRSGSYYITVGPGEKHLDLAGHKVELNGEGGGLLTFIRVPENAELLVMDSSKNQDGVLWCDGDMDFWDGNIFLSYFYSKPRYRNVIEVDGGKLTVTSGKIESGRTKSTYVYNGVTVSEYGYEKTVGYELFSTIAAHAIRRYDANAYEIVGGDAVLLSSGSATINGGKLYGRGYSEMSSEFDGEYMLGSCTRAAAIVANEGDLTINAGRLYGMGNANVLSIGKNVNFKLSSGYFETQLLNNFLFPADYRGPWDHQLVSVNASNTYSSRENPGIGAGRFGVPLDAIDPTSFVRYDDNPYYKENWSASKITNNLDGKSHSLSVSGPSGVTSQYAGMKFALESPQVISSAALELTMAQGMTLTGDTVKCSTAGVESVNTAWYRDSALITGPHEVKFGGYLAKITVTPQKGYRFDANTAFTVGGEQPSMVSAASDGSYAVVWSPAYRFDCDHSYNEDWSVHYDEAGHYQQCTVCGEKIAYEKHVMDGGSASGNITTYACTGCGYSYDKENDRVKLNGLVVDIPVAVAGRTIPTPAPTQEYADAARVMSWEMTDSKGNKVEPGAAYAEGEDYKFVIRARANDGYYFSPQAKMLCAAVAAGSHDVDDNVIITTFKIHAYPAASAQATLPAMTPGMTMGEYMDALACKSNGADSGNIQFVIKTHGANDEVYVRKTIKSDWKLERGAADLAAFRSTAITPETTYDIHVDFSTNGAYIPDDAILCSSPASYEGCVLEGGEQWLTVRAVVTSDPNKVSEIAVVSVTPPETGMTPEQDFDVLSHATLDIVSGSWGTELPFEEETEYTYTATVKLREGYVFDPAVTASVNGGKAAVRVSGDTATVTRTFPKTDPEVKVTEVQDPSGDDKTLPFTDVTRSDAYYNAVAWVYENGIMSGYSATTFGPRNNLTRAMVVQVLYNKEKKPEVTAANPFSDVPADQWYHNAVRWGAAKNVVAGFGGGVFKPDDNVTVEQVCVILHNYSGKPAGSGSLSGLGAHSDWAEPALKWATANGILKDVPFANVNEAANRAQTAQMLANYLK